ncbi:flavodoxin [Oribacterium sp. HCP28S3_H8]|uniref:flavodoxin n=1 Tax=Oribacterium sp. HCP28S3_H8 TaxID=3438945 RepID=UPI003F889AC9
MKRLVVYYSFTAGNTKKIALKIAKETGADIIALETTEPYQGSYQAVVDQGLDEVKRGFMPALKPYAVNPADYDEIIIGTPTWWYEMAPAVLTFMEKTDFSGKRIALFQTNAGWLGKCLKTMGKKTAPGKVIATGLFTFSARDAERDKMTSPVSDIDDFIKKL